MSLPSQTCAYKVKITETSFVIRAEVVSIRGLFVCLHSVCVNTDNKRLTIVSPVSYNLTMELILDKHCLSKNIFAKFSPI